MHSWSLPVRSFFFFPGFYHPSKRPYNHGGVSAAPTLKAIKYAFKFQADSLGALWAFYRKESAAPSASLHVIPTARLKTRKPGRRLKLSWITRPKPTWNGGQSGIIPSMKARIFTFISGVCVCPKARAFFCSVQKELYQLSTRAQ